MGTYNPNYKIKNAFGGLGFGTYLEVHEYLKPQLYVHL